MTTQERLSIGAKRKQVHSRKTTKFNRRLKFSSCAVNALIKYDAIVVACSFCTLTRRKRIKLWQKFQHKFEYFAGPLHHIMQMSSCFAYHFSNWRPSVLWKYKHLEMSTRGYLKSDMPSNPGCSCFRISHVILQPNPVAPWTEPDGPQRAQENVARGLPDLFQLVQWP